MKGMTNIMTERDERAILYDDTMQLGPYPDHLLKRVDSPTVAMPGPIERRSQRDNAGTHVRRGDYGQEIADRAAGFFFRYPLGSVIGDVRTRMTKASESALSGKFTTFDGTPLPKLDIPSDPKALSRNLKALAYFMGADAVGVCEVPPHSYFIEDNEGNPNERKWKYAVVFLKRNDPATTWATNGRDWIVDATAQRTYLFTNVISETLTSYIRMLGFEATNNSLHNFSTLMAPLMIAAGLGEGSRIGIPLNPFFGADFKVGSVLTDMPLLSDKPIDFGLQDYCKRCGICARFCVGKALSHGEKEIYNGYEKYIVDADKCFVSTAEMDGGSNCFVCIMMCPWTRPNTLPGDFKDWDGSVDALIASVDARADELRRNDFKRNDAPGSKWWFGVADTPEFGSDEFSID